MNINELHADKSFFRSAVRVTQFDVQQSSQASPRHLRALLGTNYGKALQPYGFGLSRSIG